MMLGWPWWKSAKRKEAEAWLAADRAASLDEFERRSSGKGPGQWVFKRNTYPELNVWNRRWRDLASGQTGVFCGYETAPSTDTLEWWFPTRKKA
jgi:hypothetical protein